MCTKTRIQNVYLGVQGACPRQAVTSAGVTAERSERRDVSKACRSYLDDSCVMANITRHVARSAVLPTSEVLPAFKDLQSDKVAF